MCIPCFLAEQREGEDEAAETDQKRCEGSKARGCEGPGPKVRRSEGAGAEGAWHSKCYEVPELYRVGRVAGLDVGERRIGLAVSDATGTLARPVSVVRTSGLDGDALDRTAAEIRRLAEEDDGLVALVVGLPRRLDGSANDMTSRVEAFARTLGRRTSLPIVLQDERLTSLEAESRLAVREKDWRVRKQRIDSAAAAIIMQDYLDSQPRGSAI